MLACVCLRTVAKSTQDIYNSFCVYLNQGFFPINYHCVLAMMCLHSRFRLVIVCL